VWANFNVTKTLYQKYGIHLTIISLLIIIINNYKKYGYQSLGAKRPEEHAMPLATIFDGIAKSGACAIASVRRLHVATTTDLIKIKTRTLVALLAYGNVPFISNM
jgi:hypothetical protein